MVMRALASARETAFGGEIELRFPFCQELVDALKSEIPGRSRKWDKADRVWRVQGVHAPAAIDLLLEHFPGAEVPHDAPRRKPSTPARTEKPTPRPPLPPLIVEPPANDQPPLAPLVAIIPCPTCHKRYEQPIRVVAETSLAIARAEKTAPELLAVCPHCATLAIVSLWPAPASAAPTAAAS